MEQAIQKRYEAALNYIKNLPPTGEVQLDNETRLQFYALFKQITEGQNKTKQPSKLKVVERYKWDAWKKLGKLSKEDAMKRYAEQLTKLAPSWQSPKPKLQYVTEYFLPLQQTGVQMPSPPAQYILSTTGSLMLPDEFTNQLPGQQHSGFGQQPPIDPIDAFLRSDEPRPMHSVDSDEEEAPAPPKLTKLTAEQQYTLRCQILAYKQLIKNVPADLRSANYLSEPMWRASEASLNRQAVDNQLLKLEKEAELRTMVLAKMNQRSEQNSEDRSGVDQIRLFAERRKNEIENLLERPDLQDGLRKRLSIQLKFLACRDIYTRLKDKVVEGLVRERRLNRHYEERFLDRAFFRREKPPRTNSTRLDRAELLLKNDVDRQRHVRHKEIMQQLYIHLNDFYDFHKKRQKMAKKKALMAKQAYELIAKKKEDEESQAQKQRLLALKKNDMEKYMKLVKDTKNQKIQELLDQTNRFLKQLGAKVLLQKGEKPSEEDAEIKKEELASMNANRVYYNLTHTIAEQVLQQPSLLSGGTLKHYQLVGLQWLVSLYNNNLNGILADEMGLGKTIQTISLFAHLMEHKKNYGPFLIVVPLTTLPNWISEFERWAPTIKRIVYRGNQNVRTELFRSMKTSKWNVCLTTYEFILKDRLKLKKFDWKYIVIDEGHRIKNAKCKFVSVLGSEYTSTHRLLLTGTPLQNSLGELWSLLNFLLPKVFNDCDDFEKWFLMPISKSTGGDNVSLTEEERLLIINRLHQVLRPFLLRRVKKEVESQLPDKREQILKVQLSSWQRILYDNISKKGALDFDPTNAKLGSRAINNIVMQLRKCCNHPFMFLNSYEDLITNDYIYRSSGKFELLDRILPKLRAFKHRILIFFQMTTSMDIMQTYLNYKGVPHLRLDGTTKAENRGDITNLFNAPNSPFDIFLLSTRAGGLGLNLQTADTVIIYDPDWNPQMDKQAEDRAHRIGQKKEVLVIRLITNTFIEEEIVQRAQQKMNLDQIFIQGGLFNLKSSDAERRQKLEDLFKKKRQDDETGPEQDIPDDEMINKYISRDENEFQTFNKMDEERYDLEAASGHYPSYKDPRTQQTYHNYRLLGNEEIPDWLVQTKKVEQEKQYGRGNRIRRQVNYNDDLLDMQIEEMEKSQQ